MDAEQLIFVLETENKRLEASNALLRATVRSQTRLTSKLGAFVTKWGRYEFSEIDMSENIAAMKREACELLGGGE